MPNSKHPKDTVNPPENYQYTLSKTETKNVVKFLITLAAIGILAAIVIFLLGLYYQELKFTYISVILAFSTQFILFLLIPKSVIEETFG